MLFKVFIRILSSRPVWFIPFRFAHSTHVSSQFECHKTHFKQSERIYVNGIQCRSFRIPRNRISNNNFKFSNLMAKDLRSTKIQWYKGTFYKFYVFTRMLLNVSKLLKKYFSFKIISLKNNCQIYLIAILMFLSLSFAH